MSDTPTTGAAPAAEATEQVAKITIQGLEFEAPQPYKPGPVELSEGEASALNQTLAENLRNNFAPKIKAEMAKYRQANGLGEDAEVAITSLDADALQEAFDKYASEYEFGVRKGGGGPRTPTDPVEREAFSIAKDKVKGALKARNIEVGSVSKEKMGEYIKQVLEKYPTIREEAQRRVQTTAGLAVEGLDL
jgi:hypothetical protein